MTLEAKRQRGKNEVAYRVNSAEIKTHYNRLRSSHSDTILPNLTEFRGLPIIHLFQGAKTISDQNSSGISTTLDKNPLVSKVLTEQLNDWKRKARDELGAILGFPSWQTSNKHLVHPVERFTARFKCRACNSVALRYAADECLDFQGVCTHECTVQKGKKKGKGKAVNKWNAEKFYKDEQVCSSMISIPRLSNAYNDRLWQHLKAYKVCNPLMGLTLSNYWFCYPSCCANRAIPRSCYLAKVLYVDH